MSADKFFESAVANQELELILDSGRIPTEHDIRTARAFGADAELIEEAQRLYDKQFAPDEIDEDES